MKFVVRALVIGICLFVVVFLALKRGSEVPAFLPLNVRIYLNSYDAARNQLGFAVFGLAVLGMLAGKPFFTRAQGFALLAIAVLIPAFEVAQFWLPKRTPDFQDVLNGWLGLIAGCALYLVLRVLGRTCSAGLRRIWFPRTRAPEFSTSPGRHR